MRALLIMAHGSPRPEANDDIRELARVIRERRVYDYVTVGYLDCNAPDIAAAVDECVAAGATEIAAVPYFLHSGKHMLRDLPSVLEERAAAHPGITIRMGDYVGREPQMAEVLLARVADAARR